MPSANLCFFGTIWSAIHRGMTPFAYLLEALCTPVLTIPIYASEVSTLLRHTLITWQACLGMTVSLNLTTYMRSMNVTSFSK